LAALLGNADRGVCRTPANEIAPLSNHLLNGSEAGTGAASRQAGSGHAGEEPHLISPPSLPAQQTMLFLSKKTVYEGFVGLHFHKGKLAGPLAPGEHWLFGTGHRVVSVDKRPTSTHVGGQEVATSDGGAFRISLIVVHQIQDPELTYRSGIVENEPSAAIGMFAGEACRPGSSAADGTDCRARMGNVSNL